MILAFVGVFVAGIVAGWLAAHVWSTSQVFRLEAEGRALVAEGERIMAEQRRRSRAAEATMRTADSLMAEVVAALDAQRQKPAA